MKISGLFFTPRLAIVPSLSTSILFSPFPLLVPIINASQRHLVAAISRRMGLGGMMSRYGNREGGGMEVLKLSTTTVLCRRQKALGAVLIVPLSVFYYRDIRKGKIISDVRFSNAINRGRYQ
ncbi:hypothetical protein TNIN_229831 [Trichonephila inaurata madagascariensis]|uniref:Uncharacterized protein n=1 Tax=Trichonephila inaurata madagascariensis TaxID=2747483 RepID=A0A8X6XET1_9ARAC|nr:hypothetical protein TNIN_229831 [Trichonephila inaurata madagascariensis]